MRRYTIRIARLEGELPQERTTVHIRHFEAETGLLILDRVVTLPAGPTPLGLPADD